MLPLLIFKKGKLLFLSISFFFAFSPSLLYSQETYYSYPVIDDHISIYEKYLIPGLLGQPTTTNGRYYPIVPRDLDRLATLITLLEEVLISEDTPDKDYPILAHQQQVIYRVLSNNPIQSNILLNKLSPNIRKTAERHLLARKLFLNMSSGKQKSSDLPSWRIINPEPYKNLLSYYRKAEKNTGIDWEILAAINLVETGMGRISGISIANARGPMQFLPSTWALEGIGNGGDINDPHDSIQAAARYLVERGGLADIKKGLWGYNNSDYYGDAVLQYAALMKDDPLAFKALYHWEIHYSTKFGDLWLPVGYSQSENIPASIYIKDFPVSAPPVYSYFN